MNSVATSVVFIPGIVALLVFLVFTYLYEQSRQQYFRAWQIGWGAYCLHYAIDAWTFFRAPSPGAFLATSLLMVVMATCIFVSTRLIKERFRPRWYDGAVISGGILLTLANLWVHARTGVFQPEAALPGHLTLELGLAVVLLFASFQFYRYAHQKSSLAFKLLAVALALWAVLMGFGQFRNPFIEVGGHLLGPIPQMLLGISMVMVLFENERNAVQENALALSTLGVDPSRVLDAKELVPSMTSILDRLVAPLPTRRAILYISERWRTVFPSVERGFSPELLEKLQAQGAGEYICELAYRRGGFIAFRNVADLAEPLPALPVSRFEHFKKVLSEDNIRHLTAVSVQTRENNFGVILFPHAERRMFGSSNLRLLIGLALQVGLTLENYVVMHDAHRRTRELAFLNNISKTAISSEDAEQMLAEIVSEIQQNFRFDHIGIGILDYVTKDIEIKAEAGTTAKARGKRVPLGVGILGRVARTGEMQLVQSTADGHLLGVLPESRAVLCIPIAYGETLLGVLNIESQRENAFSEQDRLILNTLADLLATALHNSFVFQKLQQQSITDGLTGIKTRRFFWEALTSEWKRASRSGRPFSVVLIDLDKFKEVNDTSGHLEGDLVLARVGRLLEQKCRQSNVVARYGGDEFIILMPETGIEQAQILAERLRLWVVTDPMLAEHHISGSFGVASFPVHGFSVEDIIRVADAGMYVAKHAGGNRVETAEEDLEGESAAVQRQLVSGYIEGFLQREHNGPEHVEELVATLKKLAGGEECNVHVLRDAIETVNRAAESREVQGSGHSELVARYAEVIGRALGLSPDDLTDLVFAARVHDIGKLFVAENILNKTGPLTDDEFYLMKRHARIGSEVIGIIPNGQRMQKAVEYHHESLDGAGYPAGLRGEQIPLWARILGLADAYANMTTERSFAPAKTSEQALAELEKFSGLRYDGMLVRLLIRQLKAEKAQSFGN